MKSLLQYYISRICVLLFLPLTGSGQDIHFDLVQRPQDQIGVSVFALAQDQKGLLWIGTTNGLFKFDGSQYTAYHNQPSNFNSISDDVVECIAADQQGYIWVGHHHNTSGLDRLDPSTGIFSHFRHNENDAYSISSDTVSAILQDHEGTIWIGTENGLDRFDSKTNRFYHYRHKENDLASLSFNQVRSIYEDKEGVLWVGAGSPWPRENIRKEGGLNKLDKKTGKFTIWLHNDKDPNSLTDNRIRAIFEDSHGNFWVGSAGDGLHKMDRKTGSFERLLYNPSHPDGLSRPPVQGYFSGGEDHITFIIEDVKGRLWIGTLNGGINV
jgi:ligand-binding sensor domain-containing protein